jgi:VanZ family protein
VKGASIYINGILAAADPQFPLSAKDFTGRLVLGDSPGQEDSWRGQLFGFAIYGQQLEDTQVFQNYLDWNQSGRPEHASDKSKIAMYLFDEHMGRVARNRAQSGVDLYIPERYQVVDKIVLEPFWTEFSMTRRYWVAALKNIAGFVPFGICFYAYLSGLPIKRSVLLTVALGAAVSFTIEILQGFLPTRDSGTTDLITNTLGTWIGVVSYRLVTPMLGRFLPFLPFGVARR